jgi:hypothetical protein
LPFAPIPLSPKLALPLFWAGPPKFCAYCKFPCLEIKKNNWDSITFFPQLQIESPSLKDTTLFHVILKFQNLIHVFDNVRAYPNFQKIHFGTLVF